MSETRPSALSEADIERLSRIIEKRGGNISIQDPRVNQVQTWMIGLVGMGVIVALGWLANSVDNLNRNFAGMSAWREYVDQRLSNLERK